MTKHYIAMSGDHGCLPDHCEVYPNKQSAIDDLASLFDNKRGLKTALKKDGYFELGHDDGADYCEIVDCPCSTPWIHGDGMTKADWLNMVEK